MRRERHEYCKQRSEEQPQHPRRVKHQHRHARRSVNQRAFVLFGIAGGCRDGWLFQWNIGGWCHSLGKIDIIIAEWNSGSRRELVTDFLAAQRTRLVKAVQPASQPKIWEMQQAALTHRVAFSVELARDSRPRRVDRALPNLDRSLKLVLACRFLAAKPMAMVRA